MTSEPRFIVINGAKYSIFHVVIFWLTFICYALFHASRKTLSNVKTTITSEWTGTCDADNSTCRPLMPNNLWNKHTMFDTKENATFFLGALDAIFLTAYSIGLFISGILGDRFNLRYVLSLGMIGTALSLFMFGVVSEWLELYSETWYVTFWIINGFVQSTGWPAVLAIMGNWFGKHGRGLIFGIWSATASVGNIIGTLMVAFNLRYGYHYAFVVTSSTLFAGGIVVLFALVPSPKDVGLPDPYADENEVEDNSVARHDTSFTGVDEPLLHAAEKPKAIGFFQALLLPGVIMYSLCYACLKMVNYSFMFWLPFYLSNKFGWSESVSDEISIWYDIGGVFGGIIGGVISDILQKRSVVIVALLTFAIPSLFLFSDSTPSLVMNAILMSIVGFFIGGAANMISATITADLGRQGPIQGNKEGLATVTGIVDGTGSIGAALGQLLVPLIQKEFNWFFVFYFFILLCVLTNMCVVPLFVREVRELWVSYRLRRGPHSNYSKIDSDDEDS